MLSESEWRAQEASYESSLESLVSAHLARRHHGEKHPVHDFLFEYFNYRPAQLMRWSPGIHRYLGGGAASRFLSRAGFEEGAFGVGLYPSAFPEKRVRSVHWIMQLMEATQRRSPFFGCMGLHEWAMVLDEKDVRHTQFPLRMPHTDLVDFVKGQRVHCTHFDAFRFFSASARPLNRIQPNADSREEFEQPGCLHANMDLYKWTYKLAPWTSGSLLRDAFLLAVETREIDMRASPYDLRSLGYEPICIETSEGKNVYARLQRQVYEQGLAVRKRLIDECKRLVNLL